MLGKKLITIIVCLHIFVCYASAKKSVFIISNHTSSHSQAYSIEGNEVNYQAEVDISTFNPGYGAVGNAVWPEKNLMFVTYEGSDRIVWSSTYTLKKVGDFETGFSNLAGIAIDETRDLIYVLGRNSSSLYVYSFDEAENTLVYEGTWYLNASPEHYINGMGIALDEDKNLLYVTSYGYYRVHIYDTDDFVGSGGYVDPNGYIDIVVGENSRNAIGIDVDSIGRFMYTAGYAGYYGSLHNYLVRTQLDSPYTSTEVLIGDEYYSGAAIGIGADDDSGIVFCTTALNDFRVYDSNLVLKDTEANNISGPAGVAVGGWYKTSSFSLVKDNNDLNNGCVDPINHKNLNFDIYWDTNDHPDTNMKVIDLLPDELDYNSSSEPNGQYNWENRTVTWNITGSSGHIVLRTNVNKWAQPCGTIINEVVMEGDTYIAEANCVVDVCPWGTQIIYVDWDANGFDNGTSWDDAYKDLQDALAQVSTCPVDITAIYVAAGTYKPVNDVNVLNYQNKSFELTDNVALIGHFPPTGSDRGGPDNRNLADTNNESILEGQIGEYSWETVRYVVKGQSITDGLVDGFTIQRASFYGVNLDYAYVSIVNCIIKENLNYGIYSQNFSYPDIHNCTFINNSSRDASFWGYCWPEISSCIFDGSDQAYFGFHMENLSFASISDTLFKRHTNSGLLGSGGTLILSDSSLEGENTGINISDTTATITNCSINNSNTTGINGYDSVLSTDRCVISGSNGKGILLTDGSDLTLQNSIIRYCGSNGIDLSYNISTTIKNNWIHNNGAAGITFTNQVSVPLVRNNTIYDNHTYGIWSSQNGADPNIVNCIISGNDINDLYRVNGSFNKVNYCLLQNPHSGTDNNTGSPGFLNPTEPNDLHISDTSQCRNAGDPNGNYSDEDDIDGEPRLAEGRADFGGDEYYWSKADYNKDEIVNFKDFTPFAGPWQDQNDTISLDDDNDVDVDDLALFCDDWLWQPVWVTNPWFDMTIGESENMSEMAIEIAVEDEVSKIEPVDGLMLPDVKASMDARPVRLRSRTDKFYEITPRIKQPSLIDEKTMRANALELLKLLENDWNSGGLKEIMDEEAYLELHAYAEKMASDGKP